MLLLSLMIVPFIEAIDITLSKQNYNPQETLQAEITGNFISLKSENILIYEENTPRSQPVISDLTKQGNIYYFYAILPSQQGNYSLKVEDSQYIESEETKTDTITKTFSIMQTNQSLLQINPGFILTSEDFSINLKSLNSNQEITTNFNQESQNISLIEDVQNNLEFSVEGLFGKQELKLGPYTIPIFIIEKTEPNLINDSEQTQNQSIQNQSNQSLITELSELSEIELEEYIEELGETESLSCYDIGRICLVNQECIGEKVASLEGSCCIGECIEKKEEGSGMLIGIILLVVVVGIVGFMYWKSKKKQKPKSTNEILKEKSGEFQERMREKVGGDEVTKSLGKV